MKGTKIIVSDQPKGVFKECKIVGTPKPGTVMEIDPEVDPVAGAFSWQAYGTQAASTGRGVGADGDRKVIAVLLENKHEGKTYADAYAAGDRGYLYFPVAGEELNMIANVAGTGESYVIGDEFMIDDGTGYIIEADSDAEAQPFICLEAQSALTADTWIWCLFAGHH